MSEPVDLLAALQASFEERPDLVCDRCGEHDCWAGYLLCEESDRSDVVKRSEYR